MSLSASAYAVKERHTISPREFARAQDNASGERVLAVAFVVFVFMCAVAGTQGGYFPTAWGFPVLILGSIAIVTLLLRSRPRLSPLEIAWIVSLGLLITWIGLSIAWSDDVPQSVLELQRGLIYLSAAVAITVALRRWALRGLLGGLLAAISAVCAHGLLTRFFPAPGRGVNAIILNRLSDPIGYWNGLAAFAAIGALLAVGFTERGRRPLSRALAAAVLPLLLTTIYFTYSRGAWLALAAGLAAAIAVEPRRLQLTTFVLALAPPAVLVDLVSAHSAALTRLRAPDETILEDGRRIVALLIVCGLVSGVTAVAVGFLAHRVRVPSPVRTAYGTTLAVTLALVVAGALVHFGGPAKIGDRAYHSFKQDRP